MADAAPALSWAERAAERSPSVQRSRTRSIRQAQLIVDAARRLIQAQGDSFTTHELVKEAGVALQTFYRYFGGKDELLLAVLEDMVAEAAALYRQQAAHLSNPVERLRYYLTAASGTLEANDDGAGARFVTTQHWRLQREYPAEIERATEPFTYLVLDELRAAQNAGLLHPADAARDAWLVTQLVMAVFHHYAYASTKDEAMADDLWQFCLAALGGDPDS